MKKYIFTIFVIIGYCFLGFGSLEARQIYDPSANTLATTAVENQLGFNSSYHDDESNLQYKRARYYSPNQGRFINRDPIGYTDSKSLYQYVKSNPLKYLDPTGLLEVYIWMPKGSQYGHASIELDDGTYISWFPEDNWTNAQGEACSQADPYKWPLGKAGLMYCPVFQDQTYDADCNAERRLHDYTIIIDGLDEEAIKKWWVQYQKDDIWDAMGRNCSTTVADALYAGNKDGLADVGWSGYNFVWFPEDVLDYAGDICYLENDRDTGDYDREKMYERCKTKCGSNPGKPFGKGFHADRKRREYRKWLHCYGKCTDEGHKVINEGNRNHGVTDHKRK